MSQSTSDLAKRESSPIWWGTFRIPHGHGGSWQIGPMSLWVQRMRGEWRIAYEAGSDPDWSGVVVSAVKEVEDLMTRPHLARFGYEDDSETLELSPQLADRAVVTRPERPFFIPAGGEVTVYVNSPLWIRIRAGNPACDLEAFPILTPSDTWFGQSKTNGELCYASRAFCRLRLDEMPFRPHRATTAVHVHNPSDEPLRMERMSLPVQYLSLYQTSAGQLWTQSISLEHKGGGTMAALSLRNLEESTLGDASLVCGPRLTLERDSLFRAFSSLFH